MAGVNTMFEKVSSRPGSSSHNNQQVNVVTSVIEDCGNMTPPPHTM